MNTKAGEAGDKWGNEWQLQIEVKILCLLRKWGFEQLQCQRERKWIM